MNSILPFIIVILIMGTIVFLSYYFSGKNVIIRTLRKIPLKPTSSLKANELTKVQGKALHLKEPLIAPFSGRECVFYQLKIQQRVSSGKSSHWKTVVRDEKFQDFFIETQEDFVIVKPLSHPKNYICRLVKDKEQNSGTFNDPSPKFIKLLNRYNVKHDTFFGFNKRLRYKEGIIEVGEQITVAGIAKWKSFKDPIPDYPYSKIAALESGPNQKIIITDMPEVLATK